MDMKLSAVDDPTLDDLDGVTATGLVQDACIIPGLMKLVTGYTGMVDAIRQRFDVVGHGSRSAEPSNLFEFPYDWRRDNRATYGRVDEAQSVLDRTWTNSGSEAAVPLAALLMESYVAEDRWTDGQVLFRSVRVEELAGSGLHHYIDMAFMLVNCLLRSGELQRAEEVIRQMKNEEDGELAEFQAQQLSQLSAKIRNADRVAFWARACDYLRQKS